MHILEVYFLQNSWWWQTCQMYLKTSFNMRQNPKIYIWHVHEHEKPVKCMFCGFSFILKHLSTWNKTAKHTFDMFMMVRNLSNVCFAVSFILKHLSTWNKTTNHTFDIFMRVRNLSNVWFAVSLILKHLSTWNKTTNHTFDRFMMVRNLSNVYFAVFFHLKKSAD